MLNEVEMTKNDVVNDSIYGLTIGYINRILIFQYIYLDKIIIYGIILLF